MMKDIKTLLFLPITGLLCMVLAIPFKSLLALGVGIVLTWMGARNLINLKNKGAE